MKAKWPKVEVVQNNNKYIQQSEYLTSAVHDFRLRYKSAVNVKAKVFR